MPNWVKNKIIIMSDDYKDIIKKITNKDGELDFEKLIPMPKSLKISSGSTTDMCAKLYINSLLNGSSSFNKYYKLYNSDFFYNKDWKMTQEDMDKEFGYLLQTDKKSFIDDNFKTRADVYARGKQVLDNIAKYGEKDWYHWSITNWGTKWNACETQIIDNEILFETAWDAVPLILDALANKFPKSQFHYDFAEEQLCMYCGEMDYLNGQRVNAIMFDSCSKEAYEKAFELWDCAEDFKYNKKTKTYDYIDPDDDSQDDEEMG